MGIYKSKNIICIHESALWENSSSFNHASSSSSSAFCSTRGFSMACLISFGSLYRNEIYVRKRSQKTSGYKHNRSSVHAARQIQDLSKRKSTNSRALAATAQLEVPTPLPMSAPQIRRVRPTGLPGRHGWTNISVHNLCHLKTIYKHRVYHDYHPTLCALSL